LPEDTLPFQSRRSPVIGRRGMVATSQPLAAQAGHEILNKGGTAADAAIATAAALNVTEPTSTGIGGDCFALYYEAETREVAALNGSGRAPAALSLDLLHTQGFVDTLPPFHPHTITVPGACAGWCDLHNRFGKLPLETVLAPAIRLAEGGFPVAPITAYFWARGVDRQLSSSLGGEELTINGRAPRPGEVFHNPGLARTLRVVSIGGANAFYRGQIAAAIAEVVQDAGGVLTEDDMAVHRSTWDEPISTTYRGYRIWECPPNGQGLTALLALNILESYDVAKMKPLGSKRLHLIIEALRLAFADARWYVADPAFHQAPLEELLSKTYAADRRRLINPRRATLDQRRGTPHAGSDTVYLTAVDERGDACSFINSNYMGFGTGIVPKGWGFSLQNRGHGFSLDPAHPNALAPGKRPYHTIIPALVTREDGSLFASFGVMGGFMQPQGHLQVLHALIDDGLDPQASLDRPRVCLVGGSPEGKVALEEGIPKRTMTRLAKMGHPVEHVQGHARAIFGRGQIILRDAETDVLWGGSDPRADGCALAQV
jgi:gamma-glutamyltranspeptidase/glutathione hydrolase